MRQILLSASSILMAWMPAAAMAADLVAIRPGVACRSPEALARLTLPDGESRSHAVAPAGADLAAAKAGGCIDLRPGTILALGTARRNTSIVTSGMASGPLVVPNVDVEPVAQGTRPAGGGLVVTAHLPTGDGRALEVLEDERITPDLRHAMWGSADDPAMLLDPADPRLAALHARPLLPARLRLVDPAGTVVAQTGLDQPLAMVAPAPLDGLPAPAFLLTVDESAGFGSYSGPGTTLLVPERQGLAPLQATGADGRPSVIELARTLKTTWRIVPPRTGRTQEIEFAACRPAGSRPDFTTTYSTYRYRDGGWQVASRATPGLTEFDGPAPDRALFP